MSTGNDRRPDPATISPVTERKLELNRQLAHALPEGTREDIEHLQGQLAAAPQETVAAVVEEIWATPDETLGRIRQGEAVVPAPPAARRPHPRA